MEHTTVRRVAPLLGVTLLIALSACSSGGSSSTKVASLSTGGAGSATSTTLTSADSQEAILAYAACMREHGVDMKDPTFDADGNVTGQVFGPDSGVDPRSDAFRTAQDACGSMIEGIDFGGGQRGNFDRDAVQTAMNDFTACLRDQGLDVDDVTMGGPGGGGPSGPGGPGDLPDGSVPTGSGGGFGNGNFGGTPPDGSGVPGGPGGPGGEGFDPTKMLISRLGLDETDPAVTTAISACQSIIDGAFQPTTTTG